MRPKDNQANNCRCKRGQQYRTGCDIFGIANSRMKLRRGYIREELEGRI